MSGTQPAVEFMRAEKLPEEIEAMIERQRQRYGTQQRRVRVDEPLVSERRDEGIRSLHPGS